MNPVLIVQEANREAVQATRAGLEPCDGIIVLGIDATTFAHMPGLDSLFLTLPQAEAWGSKPLPPHVSEVLRTREPETQKGLPPYVVTGVVLREGEPATGSSALQIVVCSMIRAVLEFNKSGNQLIKTIGLANVARFAPGVDCAERGRLLHAGYDEAVR